MSTTHIDTQQPRRPGVVQDALDTPAERKLPAPDPALLAAELSRYQIQRERARAEWAWQTVFGGGAREHVTYSHRDGPQRGRLALVDTGRRILAMDCSRETVEAALRLAAQQHGVPIRIAGNREFNELAAGLAGELGIAMKNNSEHARAAWQAGQARTQQREQQQDEGLSL